MVVGVGVLDHLVRGGSVVFENPQDSFSDRGYVA